MNYSRRRVIGGALGAVMASQTCAASNKTADRRSTIAAAATPRIVATPANLIVDTDAGKIRGYVSDGIATFKGIPYGDCRARFMAPVAPAPWANVRTCFSYGANCPQTPPRMANDIGRFYSPGAPSFSDENCLSANVWTPGIGSTERRPVIVWLHPDGGPRCGDL